MQPGLLSGSRTTFRHQHNMGPDNERAVYKIHTWCGIWVSSIARGHVVSVAFRCHSNFQHWLYNKIDPHNTWNTGAT